MMGVGSLIRSSRRARLTAKQLLESPFRASLLLSRNSAYPASSDVCCVPLVGALIPPSHKIVSRTFANPSSSSSRAGTRVPPPGPGKDSGAAPGSGAAAGAAPGSGAGEGKDSGAGSGGEPKSGSSVPLIASVVLTGGAAGGAYYWWQHEKARVTPSPVLPDGWTPLDETPKGDGGKMAPESAEEGAQRRAKAQGSEGSAGEEAQREHESVGDQGAKASSEESGEVPAEDGGSALESLNPEVGASDSLPRGTGSTEVASSGNETSESESSPSVFPGSEASAGSSNGTPVVMLEVQGSETEHMPDGTPVVSEEAEGDPADALVFVVAQTEAEESRTGQEGEDLGAAALEGVSSIAAALDLGLKSLEGFASGTPEEGQGGPGTNMEDGAPWFGDILVAAVKSAEAAQERKDAALREAAVMQLKGKYESEANAMKDEIEEERRRAEAVVQQMERMRLSAEAALEQQRRVLQEQLETALAKKAEEAEREVKEAAALADAKAEATVAEGLVKQLVETDQLAYQIEAFKEAFFAKSEEARKSYGAHKLAMCTFLLQNALSNGAPLKDAVKLLGEAASVEKGHGESDEGLDSLVAAVNASFPERVMSEGALTRQQLLGELTRIRSSVRQLSLLPADSSGMIAYAVARVASVLKIPETGTAIPGGGSEAALGRAEALLEEGSLEAAANALLEGCAGLSSEALAREWANMVLDRAAAEQALLVLQAHATSLASSLV